MDPFSAATKIPSINGGDARSDSFSDNFQRVSTGGLFSPFYFGGSGGGITSVVAVVGLVGVLIWLLKK